MHIQPVAIDLVRRPYKLQQIIVFKEINTEYNECKNVRHKCTTGTRQPPNKIDEAGDARSM